LGHTEPAIWRGGEPVRVPAAGRGAAALAGRRCAGELSRLEDGGLLEGALGTVPPYVRAEVARLLLQLEASEPGRGGRAEGWRRERLFSAVAELLGAVARPGGLVVVTEDVHWADGATLDCLTYLARAGSAGALTVVVTCRSDEVPLEASTAGRAARPAGRAAAGAGRSHR
jgi:hypothetical protein